MPRHLLPIICAAVVLGVFISTGASAASAADIQAQLQLLLKRVTELQARVREAQQGSTASSTPSVADLPAGQAGSFCFTFSNDLRQGTRGADVAALHKALQREGFSIPIQEVSVKEFGAGTFSGTVRFQEKYRAEVLSPASLSKGTGFVGRGTRAKLNGLFGCKLTPAAVSSGELKFYRDNRFGFSVAYPRELTVSEGVRAWGATFIEFSDPRYAEGSSGGPRYPSGGSSASVVNAIEIEVDSSSDYAGGQTVRIGDRAAKKFIGENGNPWYWIKGRRLSFRIFFYTPSGISGYRDHIRIDRFTFDRPDSGDMSLWKPYSSQPFEYTVEYPPFWSASERQTNSTTLIGETAFGPSEASVVSRYASVSVYALPLEQVKRLFTAVLRGASEAAVTVGGQNGLEYISETSVLRRILVGRGNRTYFIVLDDSVEETLFFLDRFRFGNVPASSSSSSPPVEKGQTGRYTWNAMAFQHPASWTVEEEYYRTPQQELSGEPASVVGVKFFPPGTSRLSYIGAGGYQAVCSLNYTKCATVFTTPFYVVGNDPAVARAYDELVASISHTDPAEAFRVSTPAHLEKVRLGATYEIRWQTRPDFSIDKVNIVVQPVTFRSSARALLATGDIANTGKYLWSVPTSANATDLYIVSVSRCVPVAAAPGALGSCQMYQGWSDPFRIGP